LDNSNSLFYDEDSEKKSQTQAEEEDEIEERKLIIQNILTDCEVGIKFGKYLNSWLYVNILPESSVTIPKPPPYIPCWAVKYEKLDKIDCKELHPHPFIPKKRNDNDNIVCSSCCVKPQDSSILICTQCSSFQVCYKCYYNTQIETNFKRAKVFERYISQPESWWKREQTNIPQPNQSDLVKVIVAKYMKDKSTPNETNENE